MNLEVKVKMYNMMIVDDEPLTREYMKINIPLLNDKWQVTLEAEEGQEALELLEKNHIDLVITDIKMPVMDGLELCRIINERFPKIKVIILSGYDEFAYAKEAIKYGINEYILKPIVKNEVKAALEKVTQKIESELEKEIAYKGLVNLSEYSKEQITKYFFKALLFDSAVEIKALYPIIFRFRISIVESEVAVMVISIDEDCILSQRLQLNEIPVLKFLLNQVAEEIAKKDNYLVCIDKKGNTAILVNGENKNEIHERCVHFYNEIKLRIKSSTGVSVTAGIGTIAGDEQQLNISYNNALMSQECSLFKGSSSLIDHEDYKQYQEQISDLDKCILSIKSALLDNDEVSLSISLKNYIGHINKFSMDSVIRYGIFLIDCISGLNSSFTDEIRQNSLKMLRTACQNHEGNLVINDVIKNFKYIARYAFSSELPESENIDDNDIVQKAKEYIYVHYREPLSLALIAEKIGVSSSYLSNIFHKSVGESYIKFLTRVRMEQAEKLLKSTPPYKVYDISEKVGYISVKHFSFIFKKYFKISPGEYQEKYLAEINN